MSAERKGQTTTYMIKSNDLVSYILGTYHSLPLSILPEPILAIIKKCKLVVREIGDPVLFSEDDLYRIEILTKKKDDSWLIGTPEHDQNELRDMLQKFLETMTSIPADKAKKIGLIDINPEMRSHIMYFGTIDIDRKESMDHQLVAKKSIAAFVKSIFRKSKRFGLEGIERYQFIVGATNSVEGLQADIRKATKKRSIEEKQQEQKDYLEGWIDKPPLEFKVGAQRQLRWVDGILQHHFKNQGSVLFAVGAGHLHYETGILSLLSKFGLEIFQIDSNGKAIPFKPQYHHDPTHGALDKIESAVCRYTHAAIKAAIGTQNIVDTIFEYCDPVAELYQQSFFFSRHIHVDYFREYFKYKVHISDTPIPLTLIPPTFPEDEDFKDDDSLDEEPVSRPAASRDTAFLLLELNANLSEVKKQLTVKSTTPPGDISDTAPDDAPEPAPEESPDVEHDRTTTLGRTS